MIDDSKEYIRIVIGWGNYGSIHYPNNVDWYME